MRTSWIVGSSLVFGMILAGCSESPNEPSEENTVERVESTETTESQKSDSSAKPSEDGSGLDSQQEDIAATKFDAVRQAEILFETLDGAGGFTWMLVGEDPYDGAPVLIALPQDAFNDSLQGCIVSAWDPSDYDYSTRLSEIEDFAEDIPGEAIWMGDSMGLKVELRAFSPEAECWRPSKERLGWAPEMEPAFIAPGIPAAQPEVPQVETIAMPNLVGVTESEAKTWLSRNNYKFNVSADYGFNPRLSLCFGGKGLVIGQTPDAGAQVNNEFRTTVRLKVDCEWR